MKTLKTKFIYAFSESDKTALERAGFVLLPNVNQKVFVFINDTTLTPPSGIPIIGGDVINFA